MIASSTAQPRRGARVVSRVGRVVVVACALAGVAVAGLALGQVDAHPDLAVPLQAATVNTLKIFGFPVVSNPNGPAGANVRATAGQPWMRDPLTGQLVEDPAYTDPSGPFDPLSAEAPPMDFVTWDPAWISERLGDPVLRANWPGLTGIDEVSRATHIRASSVDASEKVTLRHWYEPQHLDKDLNADGRLTDAGNDGVPDAAVNPAVSSIDEWYPAIVAELTYLLTDNDPLPQPAPAPADAHRSAPRAVCGNAGQTEMVFPVGTFASQTDPTGPLEGHGLTSLDMDFDGQIDMVSVTDEAHLAGVVGATIDFDGDGAVDAIDPDATPLSCDEMVVLHGHAIPISVGEQVQFLDHFVRLMGVTDSAAVLAVYYNGDLRPRLVQQRLVGSGSTVLAGDAGPLQVVAPGGNNLGTVPRGAWFVHLVDADTADDTAVLVVGRALGAPCAAMESASPNVPNRTPGGPWFLKRFYVDGYEYNTVAIMGCATSGFQYITLRAVLPKVPAVIEQHSVRLQANDLNARLVLPPPFNYEHTILEDVLALEDFADLEPSPSSPLPLVPRPRITYMGGPIGPIPPVLGRGDSVPYVGRNPAQPVGPYTDPLEMTWRYVSETTDPQRVGQLQEKLGAEKPGVLVARCTDCPRRIPMGGGTVGVTVSRTDFVEACGPNGVVRDVNVSVDLGHSYLGDLDLVVVAPSTTDAVVYNQVCASENEMQTVFDDEAAAPMTPADCPPTGFARFQPDPGALSVFDGEDGVGIWRLAIVDNLPGDIGELRNWSLQLSCSAPPGGLDQSAFFYNEQIHTLPWHYTEFVLPQHPDPAVLPTPYDADKYHVTSAFTSPYARWRRWQMPDAPLPASIPPDPPDLVTNATPDGGASLGAPRRASFYFDPDEGGKLFMDRSGVRMYGGAPEREGYSCDPTRPGLEMSAGDTNVTTDTASASDAADAFPVEIFPYTDPWAPFNPQHAHAPRADSLTFNPAYMDEFRNFNEELRTLYAQITSAAMNAREKVYHRVWYEPDYTTKIRFADDCSRDLSFPAVQQEYTYLYLDTTDNPTSAPVGSSRFAFPIGTGASELPVPNPGGTLPPGGEFGYGLTTFDADFDGAPDAVTVQSERTLREYLDAQWQSNRPSVPGFPPPAVPGPVLDFDGDGIVDALDDDGVPLNGNELVVFAVESLTLDLDPATPERPSAMLLDHLVTLENVTPDSSAQVRLWFTGGNNTNARPEPIGGTRVLDIGDAALVDRFQNRVTIVHPGETNPGTDGAWFVFVEDVSTTDEQVVVTIGRALGATHSAIDDGAGGHDLIPGDPWYLKRFYVDGHEYNVVALMTRSAVGGADGEFQFVTIRTPVPKGSFLNSQDSLFQQGYFLGGLPAAMSVLPPYNVSHTIVDDIHRMDATEFANSRAYDACVGTLAAARPLVERISAESIDVRLGTELREVYARTPGGTSAPRDFDWLTDQTIVTPDQYTELVVPVGQEYLLTLNWTSAWSRLHFYGCTRSAPGPFADYVPGLTHQDLADLATQWSPPAGIVPWPNQTSPPQPRLPRPLPGEPPIYAAYADAALGGRPVRVKLFYDPATAVDAYFGSVSASPATPTATPATPTATPVLISPTPTSSLGPSATPPATATPVTPAPPGSDVASVEGQVYLQGRTRHDGAVVRVDGVPVATTAADGRFSFRASSGQHQITVSHACYLDRQRTLDLAPAQRAQLAFSALAGGDVTGDNAVDLFDLVRVGSDFSASPPTDPSADCTADNAVNLFDLVLVGSNYKKRGPLDWDYEQHAGTRRDNGARTAAIVPLGASAAPSGETVTVDIAAYGMRDLYAAEILATFDPARVQVVDAAPRTGTQIQPGRSWGTDGEFFVATNAADNDLGNIAFAAGRLNPAPSLSGDVVLATVTFEVVQGEPSGAYGLRNALLLNRSGEIPTRVDGMDIFPRTIGDIVGRLFMPTLLRGFGQ